MVPINYKRYSVEDISENTIISFSFGSKHIPYQATVLDFCPGYDSSFSVFIAKALRTSSSVS